MIPIQAYECPSCHLLHRSEAEATACLKVHLDAEEVAARKARQNQERLARLDQLRFNLKSIHDLPKMILERAKMVNYPITIENFYGQVRQVSKQSYYHSHPIDKIDGDQAGTMIFVGHIGGNYLSETRVPMEGSSGSSTRYMRTIYFSDFIQNEFRGIHTGTGGSGGKSYNYDITLHLSDFPLLQAQYQQYSELHIKEKEYQARLAHLLTEYKEYYHWKKFADISWLIHDLERKDLVARLKEVESNLQTRAQELDDERAARTYLEPDFDKALYHQLISNLMIKSH